MKQILVVSGKGGTGKTIISGALASLMTNKVIADCDVDAANLHLLLSPEVKEKHSFVSGKTAFIDREKCSRCMKCTELCRFDAIDGNLFVNAMACEGCSFCSRICPSGAITMKDNIAGEWYISETRLGDFVHARLGIAQENSGKLVSLVRQKAKEQAEKKGCDTIIIDGPPGIGCPLIASLSGIDIALVVTEPTLSGLHDAKRVIEVANHFNILVKMIINKYDINLDFTRDIEKYCRKNRIDMIGRIPFDKSVVEAMIQGKTIIEHSDGEINQSIKDVYKRLI